MRVEEPIPIKDLRPGMWDACIQGTVIEVTPIEERASPPKREPRRTASFTVQDKSGRVRVVVLGRDCRVMWEARVEVGRLVKLCWARVRRGSSGESEILV